MMWLQKYKSPLYYCPSQFRQDLLEHVNTSIKIVQKSGMIHGLKPLTMRELHLHVWYTCIFAFVSCGLAVFGLLLPVFGYGTAFVVLFALAT